MPNTPDNITIPAREFVDLYAESEIPIGSPITVTQITDKPARVTFGAEPVGDYGYEPLMSVGSKVSGKSPDGAWCWSEFDCVVNVSDFFSEAGDGSLESVAGVTVDLSSSEASRTLNLPGTPDPLVSVNPVFLNILTIADQFGGDLLTANNDGTITVNQDIPSFKATCMAISRFASNENITIGIGVGDPLNFPSLPGESTDTLPLGTYISRFRDNARGEGLSREVTLQTPYFPVGKQVNLGAKANDKLFIVAWTQETTASTVIFDDVIFAVQATPLVLD